MNAYAYDGLLIGALILIGWRAHSAMDDEVRDWLRRRDGR